MKTIMEFQHPEDSEAEVHARKGTSYFCALWEIREQCVRVINKNGEKEWTPELLARTILDEIDERIPGFEEEK